MKEFFILNPYMAMKISILKFKLKSLTNLPTISTGALNTCIENINLLGRIVYKEVISLFPAAAILWTQSLYMYMHRIFHIPLRASHSAPRNSSVIRQCSNLRNKAFSRHLEGNLTSHWRPLLHMHMQLWNIYTI